ncbi:alanyl-tRNA editing protein [Ktedonospora formicarum]|uniref:Alanyl-tRNA editing protein AlaX n=1 Tax=Ktedonospora formicarum TaxID=2778364 RepID=A0A8J3I0B1_9CHLR|nr:alanyl-tRNA editing protein [Ktedonospora formicarum]GHO44460.1 alanyl-tRNA editing protein AlaX [Ktedonospora formicarum]
METQALYHTDAYIKEFDATVVAIDGNAVALDTTAFYPGGGGQPCDMGTITLGARSWLVTKVSKDERYIWHLLEGDAPVVGSVVHGVLDWERRYALMRTHTAMHILCGVVWRDYGAKVTGGNMEPLRGRMDFEFENLRAELVQEIEARINAEIAEARSTRVYFLSRAEADQNPDLIRTKVSLLPAAMTTVRIFEIEGLDIQADGGTHVANTREVERIRVVNYKSKGKINKRLEIAVESR